MRAAAAPTHHITSSSSSSSQHHHAGPPSKPPPSHVDIIWGCASESQRACGREWGRAIQRCTHGLRALGGCAACPPPGLTVADGASGGIDGTVSTTTNIVPCSYPPGAWSRRLAGALLRRAGRCTRRSQHIPSPVQRNWLGVRSAVTPRSPMAPPHWTGPSRTSARGRPPGHAGSGAIGRGSSAARVTGLRAAGGIASRVRQSIKRPGRSRPRHSAPSLIPQCARWW